MTAEHPTYPTLLNLLARHASARPRAVAIESLSGAPLTYAALAAHIERTRRALRSFGIGPRDRVAFALPDGPEAALAFLSIAAAAVAAPLNPAFLTRKFEFSLRDLPARAVIVPAGAGGEIMDAARQLSIDVLELVSRGDGTGTFDLRGPAAMRPSVDSEATPDSIAMVLYTSGTTARPKLVPLTHENLAASAHYTAGALALGPTDRALHIVPMFHVQGLVTTLLAPLVAGGTVICTPGFQPSDFLTWVAERRPTWYTAVPTMHQAIVNQARQLGPASIRTTLRFIRSSAAALSPRLTEDLEQVFGVPVVDGYGMTETAPIIACNPLPPRVRKRGSVGIAAGPELAVVDANGRAAGSGVAGEIVVRGANVMNGYEGDPEANAAAFVNGWFRTGDQGYLDADGYLFLTGRVNEIINRGGEKIAPREVEEVLLEHPDVAQTVVFGVPDERLGQIVAAAVVRRADAQVSERELREFIASRLAFFKIPGRILFLDELPKGPTGKVDRLGLAAALDLTAPASAETAPAANRARTDIEEELAHVWCAMLGLKAVGAHDNFFVLGGDSLSFVAMLHQIRTRFGVDHLQNLVQSPTIASAAEKIAEHRRQAAVRSGPVSSLDEANTATATERRLMDIWTEVLGVQPKGIHDNFFELGGESVPIARLFERIRTVFDRDLPVQALLESPTVQGLAREIETNRPTRGLVVPVQPSGSGFPVFGIHDGGGYFFYWRLARRLGSDRPFFALLADTHLNGWERPYGSCASIEDLATRYVDEIKSVQPHGPYHLCGASFGGTVAFEIARQLRRLGEDVASLFLLSAPLSNNPFAASGDHVHNEWSIEGYTFGNRCRRFVDHLKSRTPRHALRYVMDKIVARIGEAARINEWLPRAMAVIGREVRWNLAALTRQPLSPTLIHDRYRERSFGLRSQYVPGRYDGHAVLFRAMGDNYPGTMWHGLAESGLEVHDMPGAHLDMMKAPLVDTVADLMRTRIEEAELSRLPVESKLPMAPADDTAGEPLLTSHFLPPMVRAQS